MSAVMILTFFGIRLHIGSTFVLVFVIFYVLFLFILLSTLSSTDRGHFIRYNANEFGHHYSYNNSSCPELGPPSSVVNADCQHNECINITCSKLFNGDENAEMDAKKFMQLHSRLSKTESDVQRFASDCEDIRSRAGYITKPLRPSDVNFRIAFTILVHFHVEQFEQLLRAIYRPQNIYCIHVDVKASESFHSAVAAIANCFDNVFLVSHPQYVIYTGFSRLQADIECMKDLLSQGIHWHYLLNVAGQSYPLRTVEEMVDILQIYNGANDIEGIYGTKRLQSRYQKEWSENQTVGLFQTGRTNPPPPHDIDVVRGSAYGVFSRAFVEFVINDQRAKDFLAWSRKTFSPDEHYWSTLHHTYTNPHLHTPGGYSGKPDKKQFNAVFVKWSTNRDKCRGKWVRWICIQGVGDLPDLWTRHEFFVNKFDLEYDWLAFECIEEWLAKRTFCPVGIDAKFYQKLPFVVSHKEKLMRLVNLLK